ARKAHLLGQLFDSNLTHASRLLPDTRLGGGFGRRLVLRAVLVLAGLLGLFARLRRAGGLEKLLGGFLAHPRELVELGGGLLEQVAERRHAGLGQALRRLLPEAGDLGHRLLLAPRGLEHARERLRDLALDLALALDLDLQADERRGEADV